VGERDAQSQGHSTVAHGSEDQQEEVVGFDWRRPVHRARLFVREVGAQYNDRPPSGKALPVPDGH
ncbi:hypothetical protein, partial [Pseudomonas viridiflava]|uniref:hypothetical protein n=1 Tax=Pseudomonas viridiflava TaxID=33069 RepID=UPI001981C564